MKIMEVKDLPKNLSEFVHVFNIRFRDMELSDIEKHIDKWPELYRLYNNMLLYRPCSTIFMKRKN